MSQSRAKYDSCTYSTALHQSAAPFDYILNPIKYHNCNKCRHEIGLVGGTAVSHVTGNLVDLENDLRGQNRPLTKCPEYLYGGPSADLSVQGREMIKPVRHPKVNADMLHLPPCQMFDYGRIPASPPPQTFSCPKPGH